MASRYFLDGCPKLTGLPNGICTLSLKDLTIKECPKLKGLPNGVCALNLKNLERLVEDIGVQQSQGSLESLEIRECSALVYLPCELIGSSLKRLELEGLSSLKNLAGIIECLPKLAHLNFLRNSCPLV